MVPRTRRPPVKPQSASVTLEFIANQLENLADGVDELSRKVSADREQQVALNATFATTTALQNARDESARREREMRDEFADLTKDLARKSDLQVIETTLARVTDALQHAAQRVDVPTKTEMVTAVERLDERISRAEKGFTDLKDLLEKRFEELQDAQKLTLKDQIAKLENAHTHRSDQLVTFLTANLKYIFWIGLLGAAWDFGLLHVTLGH